MIKPFVAFASVAMALVVVVAEGAADGRQLMRATASPLTPVQERGAEPDAAGVWATTDGYARLSLSPDGRYSETRGNVVSGGRYVVDGAKVRFFDDRGFTAVGQVNDGLLTVDLDRFRKAQG
jgi:hypothetical protein